MRALPYEHSHQGPDLPSVDVHGSENPYRPMPEPASGELRIDPEIVLKAKKFNLAISFYYSTFSELDAEFGFGRSLSTRSYVLSSTSNNVVSFVRGEGEPNLPGQDWKRP